MKLKSQLNAEVATTYEVFIGYQYYSASKPYAL
jgi:hypothetical protein